MIFHFILKMVYNVYSLEPPGWGDSNANIQYTFILKKIENISVFRLLTWRYDYHSLARNTPVSNFFMVPKVFEPLKFYYYRNGIGQEIQQTTLASSLLVDLLLPLSCNKIIQVTQNIEMKWILHFRIVEFKWCPSLTMSYQNRLKKRKLCL